MNSKSTKKRADFVDLTGRTFERWTVLSYITGEPDKQSRYLCRCECGVEKTVWRCHLASGRTKSCGCLKTELVAASKTTHGKTGTPEFRAWQNMISRCSNQNLNNYKNYGGRGIIICKRWLNFASFLEDMGERPSRKHSIDRIDNSGNYCKENCKWSTKYQQSRNTRQNRLITHDGITLCVTDWAIRLGMVEETIRARLNRGWSISRVLTEPTRVYTK